MSNLVEHYRCSDRSCKARISARISTGNLCSDLPTHGHGNRLLKSVNDKIRDEIVTKHVKAGNSSTKTVMQEMSAAVLASDHPHTISSIPSGAAIKSQLYRANLHLTSPSHLDIGHFKLIQLRFYLIKQLFIIEIMNFLAAGILQPPAFCNQRHFEPPTFWNCRHFEPPTL